LLAKLLPDAVMEIQITTFCQKNGIWSERSHNKF